MKAITFRIELLEPVLVSGGEGDPNSLTSLDFLPGSTLRGMFIGRYMRTNGLHEFDAADPRIRRLFFDGSTRYLNAYPVDSKGRRTLPTPASWHKAKGADDAQPLYDFVHFDAPDRDENGDFVQWRSIGTPYCSPHFDGTVELVSIKRHIAIHTKRNRRKGRATSDDGQLFRFDALSAGQEFAAVILCDNDADAELLAELVEGEGVVGVSRSAGYGLIRLWDVEVEDVTAPDAWREVAEPPSPIADYLILTCLSDLQVRDVNGQFCVDAEAVAQLCSKQLGATVKLVGAFMQGRVAGGFNRKWGLPLPQIQVVRRGSVFVFSVPSCSEERLRTLEWHGLGDGLCDGFGRIVFNWLRRERWMETAGASERPEHPVYITSSAGIATAQRIADRILRNRLNAEVQRWAAERTIERPPIASQIARLRSVIQNQLLQPEPDPEAVIAYIERVESRSTILRQFANARVEGLPLHIWLKQLLSENASVAQEIQKHVCSIGGVTSTVSDSLAAEHQLRCIDALLARAAKTAQRGERE